MGLYVEDTANPPGPLAAWIQEECRVGRLSWMVGRFCESQPEDLVPELVKVVKVDETLLTLSIPTRLFDHESATPFETEVVLELNPLTGQATRKLA